MYAYLRGYSVSMVLIGLLAPLAGAQVTLHVDDDAANDPGPGDSAISDPLEDGTAGHPFDAIQEAIDAAADGDTVLVLDGTYTGTGNRDMDFNGKAITVRSQNGPDNCIIDCQGSAGDPHRGFYFHSGEYADSVLEGVMIRNGYSAEHGGAMHIVRANPLVRNCVFELNYAPSLGGALWVEESRAILQDCILRLNSCGSRGGALWLNASATLVEHCTFENNNAGSGGAIYTSINDRSTLDRCILANNEATSYGGGVRLNRAATYFSNTLFVGNTAGNTGGACFSYGAPTTFLNCTIVANTALGGGGGIEGNSESRIVLDGCVVWDNMPNQLSFITGFASYCCVEGGVNGAGNISNDPLFVDADGPDNDPDTWQDNDYRLASGSPCIDAGNTAALPRDSFDLDSDGDFGELLPLDLEGGARILDDPATPDTGRGQGAIVDMGAYEYEADCNGNGVRDSLDISSGFSADCNGNSIPDECDTVNCDPNDLTCQDCDGNGIPDGCELSGSDCDSNGVLDVCESDTDGDGTIDACDGCPLDPAKTAPGDCGCGVPDTDGDGIEDCLDNCPFTDNPGQEDCDGDGIGDACDPLSAVVLNAEPLSQAICAGDAVLFDVDATGQAPLTYQWYHNGQLLAGATGSALLLNDTTLPEAGLYEVEACNPCGCVTSAAALLTVEVIEGDVDQDGDVDISDLAALLAGFGLSCP